MHVLLAQAPSLCLRLAYRCPCRSFEPQSVPVPVPLAALPLPRLAVARLAPKSAPLARFLKLVSCRCGKEQPVVGAEISVLGALFETAFRSMGPKANPLQGDGGRN